MRRSDFGGLQRDDGARRVGRGSFRPGAFPSTGRIMKVKSYVFGPERLRAVNAFKVPQLLRGSAFFTDEVVVAVERAGLRGSRISLGLGGISGRRLIAGALWGRVGQLRGIVLTFTYGSKSKARARHDSAFQEESGYSSCRSPDRSPRLARRPVARECQGKRQDPPRAFRRSTGRICWIHPWPCRRYTA